jgi:twitching motility protein PilT
MELLVNTPAVGNCIREGKTFMLPGIMQVGKALGMITMDDSLKDLCAAGLITQEEAIFRAIDQDQMRRDFKV